MKKGFFIILSLSLLVQIVIAQETEKWKIENLIDEILKKVENYYSSEEVIPEDQILKQREMQKQLEKIRKQLEILRKQKEYMDPEKFQEEMEKIYRETIEIQKTTQELLDSLKEKTKPQISISPTFIFKGNTEISENDFIEGDVLVQDGDLVVYGRINGNILVENGDVNIKSGAEVNGDIYTTNGEVIISEDAKFSGQIYRNFHLTAEVDKATSYSRKKHRTETKYKHFYEEQPGFDNFYFEFESNSDSYSSRINLSLRFDISFSYISFNLFS
ncbi:MAG: polymer-forming cytoskeletal protein [Candidatus Kryptonium sp.]